MKIVRLLEVHLERRSAALWWKKTHHRCFGASYLDVEPTLTRLVPSVIGFYPIIKSSVRLPVSFATEVSFRSFSGITKNLEKEESAVGSNEFVDVEDEDSLLAARIKAEIPPIPSSLGFIFRVPGRLRVVGEDTYDPRIVSIGPYHHGKESLKPTERYKKWYLDSFISRTKTPNTSLKDFVKAIKKLEIDARECYEESINLSSDEFVRMMVFDGCFILELFYKSLFEKENIKSKDVIFSSTWIVHSLRRDLLLLENQIPFIVLECLFNQTTSSIDGYPSLAKLVTSFFVPILPTIQEIKENSSIRNKHLLDLLRNHLLHPSLQMDYGKFPLCEYTQSATELSQAGVKFRKKKLANGLLDITFTNNGVVEIPEFHFGVSWTVLLPNIVALEQCRQDYTDQITSYVILLDTLINSHSDVKLLRDKGIINKLFKEDENVALAINSLYKRVVVNKFYHHHLCRRINMYSRTTFPRLRASFIREYLNTPWSTIKLLGAFVAIQSCIQFLFSLF
ncbi:hypothetical protein AQUCO_01200061v1 [Aquilegia coerulea]|uniref:Uncharacterized protein n=1 Tax=Aquilegia coerulea TaxID=218851 RepID=A0A2G5E490_AQUCA|nr:hypothetical protein AQUCO_01200061v1 [Aquilegia coerulea]